MIKPIISEFQDNYSVDKYLIPPQIKYHRKRNLTNGQIFKVGVPIRTLPHPEQREESVHPLDKLSKKPPPPELLPHYFPNFPPNSLKVPKPKSGQVGNLRVKYSRIIPQTPLFDSKRSKSKSLSPSAVIKTKKQYISVTRYRKRFLSTIQVS